MALYLGSEDAKEKGVLLSRDAVQPRRCKSIVPATLLRWAGTHCARDMDPGSAAHRFALRGWPGNAS